MFLTTRCGLPVLIPPEACTTREDSEKECRYTWAPFPQVVLTVNSSWVHPLGRPALRLRRQAPPFLAANPRARQVRLAV